MLDLTERQFIILDLDQTICTYSRSQEAVLMRAFEECDVEPFFTIKEFKAAMETFDDADEVTTMSDRRRRSCEALALEHGYDRSIGTELGEVYSHRRKYGPVKFLDGAEKALSMLADQYELGLITNAEEAVQRPKLEQLGISSQFETIVYAGDDTEYKPNPEPFERALREGKVTPDDALYVGDSFDSDVLGATAVGIDTVWVSTEAPPTNDNQPTVQIDSLAELPPLLGA